MNHGPTLVDNNVFIGQDVRSNSEATVFAQNLFVDCGYDYRPDLKRRSQYYEPHTTIVVGSKTGTAREERWHNNIFVRRGLDGVEPGPGHRSDHNAFLAGAARSTFGDEHSLVSAEDVSWATHNRPSGVDLRFSVPEAAAALVAPQVDAASVGRFSTVGQTIEDRHGAPLSVACDFRGQPFRRNVAGPLADLKAGTNVLSWTLSR
jgi:hypothetical protein